MPIKTFLSRTLQCAFLGVLFCCQGLRAKQAIHAPSSGPKVTLSGKLGFNGYIGGEHNKKAYAYKKNPGTTNGTSNQTEMTSSERDGKVRFAVDSANLEFQIQDAMDAFFNEWMIQMSLSGDRNSKIYTVVPAAYMAFFSPYLSLTMGGYAGVETTMAHGGVELLGGTGGFGSRAVRNFVTLTTGVWPKVSLIGDSIDCTKMTLQSARFEGFQLGLSFAPDTNALGSKNRGDKGSIAGSDLFYNRNLLAGGIDFVDFVADNVKLSASIVGVAGSPYATGDMKNSANPVSFYKTTGVMSGLSVDFSRFSVGGEFGWTGQSAQFKGDEVVTPLGTDGVLLPGLNYQANQAQGPRFFDVVCALFLNEETKIALGYLYTTRKTGFDVGGKPTKATCSTFNASLTYQATGNVQTYLEVFYHDARNKSAVYEGNLIIQKGGGIKTWDVVTDQKAFTLVVGTTVRF